MGTERSIYRLLSLFNSTRAASRTIATGSPRPAVRRVARVAAGRVTGRAFGRLFK